jgi:uncharacterized protein YprB with RNaseH-like and TPR domain
LLEQSFIHLSGIGSTTEKSLWKQGCRDWDCFLSPEAKFSVGSASRQIARDEVLRSRESLQAGHHQYFANRLRQKDVWRAYADFKDSCVFLDIETEGTADAESVTAIGMYDGREFVCLLKGEDLESFRDRITHYSMIVTFYGTGFDLPVLNKRFPGLLLDQIHIDLCPALRQLGYRGGLKAIEREVGLERSEATAGLSGFDAVRLWRAHLRGSQDALDVFVQYNREDTVNLLPLADLVYAKLREKTLPGKILAPVLAL